MSLATTGGAGGGLGGAGGGGLTMAHDASGGMMNTMPNAPPPPTAGSGATGTSTGITLPQIEVCDKTQKLSLSKVKAVGHLPITAVDLHAGMPTVALYPPSQGSNPSSNANANTIPMQFLGKMKGNVALQANETSHKTLRKYLTQAKPYSALKEQVLTTAKKETTTEDASVVVLDRPHLWLGLRRVQQLNSFQAKQFTIDSEVTEGANNNDSSKSNTANMIAEESHQGVGCWWTNSTLLGHSPTTSDYDVDRVAAKIRLDAKKKALTLLPEEGTQLLLNQARQHVLAKFMTTNTNKKKGDNADNSTTEVLQNQMTQFPMSIALPAWCFYDGYMEALYEAVEGVAGEEVALNEGNSPTVACLFPRSISGLMGCMALPASSSANHAQPQPSALLQRLAQVQQNLLKRHQQLHGRSEEFDASVTVLCVGTTPEGCEVTAVQLSQPQNGVPKLPFEQVTVLANVSKQIALDDQGKTKSNKPSSLLASCFGELNQVMDLVAPEVDGPAAIMSYGTTAEQEAIKQALQQYVKDHDNESGMEEIQWLNKVPLIFSPVESIATGAALLGGIAMGRHNQHNPTSKSLPIKIRTVAAVSTGVMFNYTTSKKSNNPYNAKTDSSNIKTIFDFDRRLPAGPYSMEFKASECVVHAKRAAQGKSMVTLHSFGNEEETDEFLKLVKEAESSKFIPEREKAALNFQVQIYQKWTRDGPWQPVGNPIAPLVKLDTPIDKDTGEDKEEVKVACEQVSLELSMAVTGILATAWVGERESVVQAVKSARGRLYEYYGWLTFAILFFGGFFVKSYWEDYVWKRDTQRLLDYYAHVIPNSTQDGDRDTASWLAYKYRNNKAKLWDNLETKYGVPVPEGEWPEDWEDPNANSKPEDPEHVDLDGNEDDGAKEDGAETEAEDGGAETEAEEEAETEAEEQEEEEEPAASDSGDDEPDL